MLKLVRSLLTYGVGGAKIAITKPKHRLYGKRDHR